MNNTFIYKFKILSTNHILIKCKLNKVSGNFILDTGASNSCVDLNDVDKFKLIYKKSDEIASSATGEIKGMYISKKNSLIIGKWFINSFDLMIFNMKNIIDIIREKENIKIDGILGSDILTKYNSKIDYKNKQIILEL